MKVKPSIFGSNSERDNYYNLKQKWLDKFTIYQNVPLLMVLNIEEHEVSRNEFNFLKATSIDYILCELWKKGGQSGEKPFLGIEFDGIQQGVSIGINYLPKKGFDKSRKWKLETKLKIAAQANFPLIVVGDNEFNEISDTNFNLIDGIIGRILAQMSFKRDFSNERKFEEFINDRFDITLAEFDALPHSEAQDVVESWGINTEIDSELENNPITQELWRRIKKICEATGKWYLPGFGGFPIADSNQYHSMRAMVTDPTGNIIERVAVIPKFGLGAYSLGLLDRDIAQLLVIVELGKRLGVEF